MMKPCPAANAKVNIKMTTWCTAKLLLVTIVSFATEVSYEWSCLLFDLCFYVI